MRGGALDHLVQDFTGTRYFVICTNHESSRQHSLRKMGDPRAKPIPTDGLVESPEGNDRNDGSEDGDASDDGYLSSDSPSEDSDDPDNMTAPCVNYRTDADDDLTYTNKQPHGPNVLRWSSSSAVSSLD